MRRSRHLWLVRLEVLLLLLLLLLVMMMQGLLHLLLLLIEVLLAGAAVRAIVLRSRHCPSGAMLFGKVVIMLLAVLTLVLPALHLASLFQELLAVKLLEVGLLLYYFRLDQSLVRQLLLLLCAHRCIKSTAKCEGFTIDCKSI